MKISNIILGIVAVSSLIACENNKIEQPQAAMTTEKYIYNINESMEIHFTGTADNVVIYTGDTDHDYNLREESNYGLIVNKGLFTYSYQQPGTYKVVCVATNHADEGQTILRDTCSLTVKVIDDVTEIYKLSAPQVLYDEVFAELVNESDWVLSLPRKIKYKTSTPSVSLSQKLKFYIHSDSTTVFLNDEEFSSSKKYNLENKMDIFVRSHEGSERSYRLYTVNYGEFEKFSLSGVEGTVTRTEYDYSYYEINLVLPSGSDVSDIAPVFTLYGENEKAFIGDTEQISGSTRVDFTQPVTYRIVATHPENPEISIESTFVVNVTVQ